ncbi:hypothetical protein L6452_35507 [Arctium lappa]|uniref:Uncharacterized protein n=1 Tax=Arctium lappa TaxID=4217 RepID=A0ACB8Y756_ARCLA|nr:hypothetical protein L6452_35507 [Arctium lappa]
MLLAKQQEAGKALMAEAEDEFWLEHSDVEEEQEESAHLCLMGKEVIYDDSDDDTADEEIDMFDFNAPLPNHSTFLINGEDLPSVYEKGESSTKVGESISVNADYYAKGKKHKK